MTIQDMIAQIARAQGIDPALALAVAQRESNFNPAAVGPAGEIGVFQLGAAAAQDVGINRYDLAGNILGGVLYLKRMLALSGGDEWLAVAAYNAGWSNVSQGVIPSSTQSYAAGVLAARTIYADQLGGQPPAEVATTIPAPYLPQTSPEDMGYEYVPEYTADFAAEPPSWSPATVLALAAAGIVSVVVLTR